jgi:hypothetical protein
LADDLVDRTIWDKLDTELAKHERSAGYAACSAMFKGKQGQYPNREERIIVWSWWWNELWKEAKKDTPDVNMCQKLWELEKGKMTMLPKSGKVLQAIKRAKKRGRHSKRR